MYQFKARSGDGTLIEGTVKGENRQEAATFVRANYGVLLELRPVQTENVGGHYAAADRISFFRQLAIVLQSGMLLTDGLNLIAEGNGGRLLSVCQGLGVRVANGQTLAQAMSEFPSLFPKLCVSLMQAGELSGELPKVAAELADFYAQHERFKKLLVSILFYPLFLLAVTSVVLVFFLLYILPVLAETYQALQAQLGGILQFAVAVQSFVYRFWPLVLLFGAGVLTALWRWQPVLSRLLFRLPGLRSLRQGVLEIRFCRLLAMLLQSGISIIEALHIVGQTLDDFNLTDRLEHLNMLLAVGTDIGTALAQKKGLFTPQTRGFLMAGVRSGSLPEMLLYAAQLREDEVDHRLNNLKEYLAPLLLLGVALITGLILVSVMSPVFDLFNRLPEY